MRTLFGLVCLALGVALVAVYLWRVIKPTANVPAGQGIDIGGVMTELAKNAPMLAAALAFVLIGAVVLGYLQLDLAVTAK